MNHPCLAASLMAANLAALGADITRAETHGVDLFHWDIMDGHFVPNLTFGAATIAACRGLTTLPFDAHLMVTDPEQWIAPFAAAGVDNITVHIELGMARVASLITMIKEKNIGVGVAFNPATPLTALDAGVYAQIDRVLIMSVNPGFGGQAFIDVTDKITAARAQLPHADIMVDGGINAQTSSLVRAAGATTLVSGSALFTGDMAANITAIRGGVRV